MPFAKSDQRLKLVDILVDNFTADELRNLVYAILGVGAYEDLQGTSKRGTAGRLLEYLESTDRVDELIDLIGKRRPDIELPDLEGEAEPDSLKRIDDESDMPGSPMKVPWEIGSQSETESKLPQQVRQRRSGYDHIYDLVQKYDTLSSDELAQMRGNDLVDSYVQPMFEALGWSVSKEEPFNVVRGIEGSRVIQVDLLLSYRDLRVLVEVKRPSKRLGEQADDQLFHYLHQTRNSWGFLTNFETIRILDLRDLNQSTLLLETSPRLYVADDDEEHDLLAAAVFYNRFAPRSTQPQSVDSLIQSLEDKNDSIRQAAIEALGTIGDPQAVESLIPILDDSNESIRLATVVALGEIGNPRAIEDLSRLRQDPNDSIRLAAVEALGRISGFRAEETRARTRVERIEIATRALADTPSRVDLLGFSVYAKALADFIENEKTEKPLTIGIDAAWGMGKTTLMLMIRHQLTGQGEKKGKHRRLFPTVWFNAWKYDQEESLWAALALEILAQVRSQFNWRKRAQLWVKLNYGRLDQALLWRSVLKLLAYVVAIYLLGAVVFGVIALWLGTDLLGKYIGTVGILGFVAALYTAGKEIYDRLAGPFDLKLAEYVRKPNYEERIGFLAQFEEDFKRVINVVTEDGGWPLVVFIDDLDRCAPPKPAEIIEAINILLDAKHCVFVIGMDAQAVAGSIEAKYESLQSYLDDADDPGGLTLGQRFLEKIVQINFRIPRADPKVVKSFVDANLDALRGGPPLEPTEQEVIGAEQLIEAEQRAGKSLDEAAQAVQVARPDIPREVVTKAREEVFAKSFDDSEEVRRAIHRAIQYLGLNPRKIKRFINIFRLQALIANRRGLLEGGIIRLDLLAKWMIVAMRWPHFAQTASDDENWIASLVEAHDIHGDLIGPSALPADDQRRGSAQSRLDLLLADPRVKRWVDTDDLVELLKGITTQIGWNLSNYTQLAQTASEGSYKTGGTGLS